MTVSPPQSLAGVIESKATKDNVEAGNNSVLAWCSAAWRPMLAEVVATGLLVLLGCMTTIPIDGIPYQPTMYAAMGFGFVISINVQIFGHISGAHMNPSVSLAAVLWGNLSITLGIGYVIAQCIGALLGYAILVSVAPLSIVDAGVCVTAPHAGLTMAQALGVEIALATALNLLICGVWDPVNKDRLDSVALKFGLAIAGLALAGGHLTGASMNPARSLGPAVWTGSWTAHWVYWVGPLIGGALAPLMYKLIWLKKEKTEEHTQ